jgi:hypothetical protein
MRSTSRCALRPDERAKLLDVVARLERSRSAIDAADPLRDEDSMKYSNAHPAQEHDGTTLQHEAGRYRYAAKHQQARSVNSPRTGLDGSRDRRFWLRPRPPKLILYALLTDPECR